MADPNGSENVGSFAVVLQGDRCFYLRLESNLSHVHYQLHQAIFQRQLTYNFSYDKLTGYSIRTVALRKTYVARDKNDAVNV